MNTDSHAKALSIKRAILKLPLKEKIVFRMRYGIGKVTPKSVEEVAEELNLTVEQVVEAETNALRKLRELEESPPRVNNESVIKMAYCTNCGQQLTDGAKFCANCGASTTPITTVNNPSPLSFGEAKRRAYTLKTNEAIGKFYEIFAEMVKNGAWVNAPANGSQLVIASCRDGYYIAIYSDMNGRVAGDSKDVIATDINKFIDVLYDNPRLHGIMIDPNKDPCIISRKEINDHTVRKDPHLQVKDI